MWHIFLVTPWSTEIPMDSQIFSSAGTHTQLLTCLAEPVSYKLSPYDHTWSMPYPLLEPTMEIDPSMLHVCLSVLSTTELEWSLVHPLSAAREATQSPNNTIAVSEETRILSQRTRENQMCVCALACVYIFLHRFIFAFFPLSSFRRQRILIMLQLLVLLQI